MSDRWADWIRTRRTGGDAEYQARMLEQLGAVRDRVLAGAELEDKERAYQEFHRVLRPGGRVSLFEPINRFGMEERRRTWGGYDVDGRLIEKLNVVFEEIQPRTDPMVDFDERDLLALAERAGFFPIKLAYEADIEAPNGQRWTTFLHSSWNPKLPTLEEAMDQALTAEGRAAFVDQLRPLVENGRGVWRMAHAYLWAVKP